MSCTPAWYLAVLALCILAVSRIAPAADDLTPVTVKPAPTHAPVVLARDGKALATIVVAMEGKYMTRSTRDAVGDLQKYLTLATGAKFKVVYGKPTLPAIVIGDCPLAAQNGLVSARMPPEGFAIKTMPDAVLIVGRDGEIAPRTTSRGTTWAIYDFLERFVGVRWYWPGDLGASVPTHKELAIEPVWIEDAPVFLKREIWPSGGPRVTRDTGPQHRRLRSNDCWPVHLVVHAPHSLEALYAKTRPEIFQLRSDGKRNFAMLCYGNPMTLLTYLEEIGKHFDHGQETPLGIVGNAITVSPNDMAIACYCPDCRRLWNKTGGQYGTASKGVGTFVANLSREVKRHWPGKQVIYLPYKNYTDPPQGVTFADNVEVQLCGMPGLAQYKEPSIRASEQANIDGWVRITGRKIQNWHYSCWPEDKTKAAYLFPHVISRFYRDNRDKVVGTFINGVNDHWRRQHISLYVWMKVLWNPAFDVDAAVREYCRRMYGPAAGTMLKLVTMQIDGWEKSRWPDGQLSPKAVYEYSYPRKDVVKMEGLLARAFEEAKGDALVTRRLEYYAGPPRDFFDESKQYAEGGGRTKLIAQKVGENPVIDGKLDDAVWQQAPKVHFIRALDKTNKTATFPTTLQAVWTLDGVTFGFHMSEPTPEKLARKINGLDAALAWWDDNVEIFLDVKGLRTGYYQLIINANAALWDAKGKDMEWTCEGLKAKAFVGKDFWSLEVYIPYTAFKDAVIPATGVTWFGNFTRHRVCDRKHREYQRLNTTYQGPSANMMAFGPIQFVE